jgi:regulator of sigma E protease
MNTDILLNIIESPLAIISVVFFFGASIFIHELGHFLAARWRGLVIERFSIGFGPRLFGWKGKSGVDYRVSLLPLGGYVALPQMVTMEKIEGANTNNYQNLPEISYWDKMIVAVAGAVFNVLFAFLLSLILWFSGSSVQESLTQTKIGYILKNQTNEYGESVQGAAYKAGLQPGDIILTIDGKEVENWMDIVSTVMTGTQRDNNGNPLSTFVVNRRNERKIINVSPVLDENEHTRRIGITPADNRYIYSVMENSPAQEAGIQKGDQIYSLNGRPIFSTMELLVEISQNPDAALKLGLIRDGEHIEKMLTPKPVVINKNGDKRSMIGIQWQIDYAQEHIAPQKRMWNAIESTFQVLGALLSPKSDVHLRNMSGPIGIGHAIYLTSLMGFTVVLNLIVIININLAILNLLPLPVLDGGHMAIATIEKIAKRKIPLRLIETIQATFIVLLFSMIIYVSFFDINRVSDMEQDRVEEEKQSEQYVTPVFSSENQNTNQPTEK